jgi:hypothetical protein
MSSQKARMTNIISFVQSVLGLVETMVVIVSGLATCIAALVAGGVAVIGLSAWKKQIRGKTEYDLALRVLTGLETLRTTIRENRGFISTNERSLAMKKLAIEPDPNIYGEQREEIATSAALKRRYNKVVKAYLQLQKITFEGEAIWGEAFSNLIKPIQNLINTLLLGFHMSIRHYDNPVSFPESVLRKFESTIYAQPDTEDDLENQLNLSITNIHTFLNPFLRMR